MPDRDKAIMDAEEAIEILSNVDEPTPWCDFVRIAFGHALELLKAQKPVEPHKVPRSIAYPKGAFVCPDCSRFLEPDDPFCPGCGRAVKWDD